MQNKFYMIILLRHCYFYFEGEVRRMHDRWRFYEKRDKSQTELSPGFCKHFSSYKSAFRTIFCNDCTLHCSAGRKVLCKVVTCCFKPGKAPTRISTTASFDIFIASTRYNLRKWQYRAVCVLIITIDYAHKKHRPPRVSNANKAY